MSYLYSNGGLEGRKLLAIPAAAGILSQNTITTQMTRSHGSGQGKKILVGAKYSQKEGMHGYTRSPYEISVMAVAWFIYSVIPAAAAAAGMARIFLKLSSS
jgi:hypothetical protein